MVLADTHAQQHGIDADLGHVPSTCHSYLMIPRHKRARAPLVKLIRQFCLGCTLAQLGAIACTSTEKTQLVVSVDTDLLVPTDIDKLRLEISQGRKQAAYSYALNPGDPSGVELPATLVLNLGDAEWAAPFEVAAVALLEGSEIVRREARVQGWVRGAPRLLRLNLLRSCAHKVTACAAVQTCTANGCRSRLVDPVDLPLYTPEAAFSSLDASTRDGSFSPDAGVRDASPEPEPDADAESIDVGLDAPRDATAGDAGRDGPGSDAQPDASNCSEDNGLSCGGCAGSCTLCVDSVCVDPPEGPVRLRIGHSGACLNLPSGTTEIGVVLHQWACVDVHWERFRFIRRPDTGSYEITSTVSRKCLDVRDMSAANGASLQQWDCLGAANQRFRIDPIDATHFRLVAEHSGKCLGVRGASLANGAVLHQWDCLARPEQYFEIIRDVN